MFRVTSRFVGISQPVLTLSLPIWSPGWYTIENDAKSILRMRFMDGEGRALPHRMTHKQTWEIDTARADEVRVEFDYRANLLALNQATITSAFAFFTGTQLFLEAVGHREEPETVRIVVPEGWRILSAIRETTDPGVFVAEKSVSDDSVATTTSPVAEMTAKCVDVPSPTAQQLAIRKAWLIAR